MNISNKKIFIFITVRIGSSRLPAKCLKKINNKKIIEIIIQRAKKIGYPIIILTTKNKSDDILCNLAKKNKIMYYRGSSNNVLKRWYDCGISFDADIMIMVDADDLLFDYEIYKNALKKILTNKFDYIKANENSVTGLFTYIFKAEVIKNIYIENKNKKIETIGPYLGKKFKFCLLKLKRNKKIRFTLDYEEDLIFFKKIFSRFSFNVKTNKVIAYLKKNKSLTKINSFRQNDYLKNQRKKYEKLQRLEV